MSTEDDRPSWHVELELFSCHLASELGVDEISAPLRRAVEVFARSVAQRERASHEHPTPLIHEGAGAPGRVLPHDPALREPACHASPTLPTVPPGVDEREVPTRRTRSITRTYGRSE